MHQTLLALMALFAAGLFTISQVETQHDTVEAVVRDQFELSVAGTLLHAMEFADSRSFDAAVTPAQLRQRYGLGSTMTRAERDTISFDDLIDIGPSDFSSIGSFGGGVSCNIADPAPATVSCNDIDDLHSDTWQTVDLRTADGHSLPVEVRVAVTYVESGAGAGMDTPVNYRTNHKRVEVFARTNSLKSRNGVNQPIEVSLSRVMSFDPKVAAEYLRRSIAVDGEGDATCEAQVGPWNTRMSELRQILAEANAAYSAAANAMSEAQGTLSSAQSAYNSAAQALANAQSAEANAQGAYDAAVQAVADAQAAVSAAQSARNAASQAVTNAQAALSDAQSAVNSASQAYSTAQNDLSNAESAQSAADAAYANAQAATEAAEDTRDREYDEAVDALNAANAAFYQATYVSGGRRYWRSPASYWRDDYYDGYVQTFYAERQEYYDAYDEAVEAQEAEDAAASAARAAAQAVADAENTLAAASNALASANAAVTAAEQSLSNAQSALSAAEQAITDAQNALSAAQSARSDAATALSDAQAATSAAASAASEAQAALNAAQSAYDTAVAAAQEASDDAVDAQRDVDDHESTRPECDDEDESE